MKEGEGLLLWLLRCDEVLEFLQFLVQGGECLVRLLHVAQRWREILLLGLGSEWWHVAHRVLLRKVQKVEMRP